MKFILLIILIILNTSLIAQSKNTSHFCDSISGVWAVNISSINHNDYKCVETKTILKNGLVSSIRNCNKGQSIYEYKVKWTRFDQVNMKIYGRYYNKIDDNWSDETELYRVISISSKEIKLEVDGETKDDKEFDIITYRFRRIE